MLKLKNNCWLDIIWYNHGRDTDSLNSYYHIHWIFSFYFLWIFNMHRYRYPCVNDTRLAKSNFSKSFPMISIFHFIILWAISFTFKLFLLFIFFSILLFIFYLFGSKKSHNTLKFMKFSKIWQRSQLHSCSSLFTFSTVSLWNSLNGEPHIPPTVDIATALSEALSIVSHIIRHSIDSN